MSEISSNDIIASLTIRNERLSAKNQRLNLALDNIHLLLICIGGPLNDNFHGYNKEQRAIFHRIEAEINSAGIEKLEAGENTTLTKGETRK